MNKFFPFLKIEYAHPIKHIAITNIGSTDIIPRIKANGARIRFKLISMLFFITLYFFNSFVMLPIFQGLHYNSSSFFYCQY